MIVHWFRRDLRLRDNLTLQAAGDEPVLPVFILDPALLRSGRTGAPRLAFLLNALQALDKDLRERGTRLVVRTGRPVEALRGLLTETGARQINFAADHSLYARGRDEAVLAALPACAFHDQVIHAPGTILTKNDNPYTVFTPFKRAWLALPAPRRAGSEAGPAWAQAEVASEPIPALADLGHTLPAGFPLPPASEATALKRLRAFSTGALLDYAEGRNALAEEGTSRLSPYLRFGLLSPRMAYWAAREAEEQTEELGEKLSAQAWVSELIWREFYQHLLHFFPHVVQADQRPGYADLEWRDAPEELAAWREGRTGYPVVDAAMRQLAQTGWMPNRTRMITASFLTKDLLIDWRQGERYFMRMLVDGDLAANNGGWQWCAGTGADAQPYFRIFNPVLQSRKFDPDGKYIRHWLPELCAVPAARIHAPWEKGSSPPGYPAPIIEHAQARQRTLAAFGRARESGRTKGRT